MRTMTMMMTIAKSFERLVAVQASFGDSVGHFYGC